MSNGYPTAAAAAAPLTSNEDSIVNKDRAVPTANGMNYGTESHSPFPDFATVHADSKSRVVTQSQESSREDGEESLLDTKPAARKRFIEPMTTSTLVTAPGEEDTPKPISKKPTPDNRNPSAEISVSEHFSHSGSISSDLSAASVTAAGAAEQPSSPSSFKSIPPAPPSTPASSARIPFANFDGLLEHVGPPTIGSSVVKGSYVNNNANRLEAQHKRLLEEALTPVPQRPSTTTTPQHRPPTLPEDFSDWAVGDRYDLVRILGRGSYGEVAQAIDLQASQADSVQYVAIKRIQSPFDQQVDAVRLYRELHILRRLRDGVDRQSHDCIIRLLDVVQPPTDDLDDFHDLYLVFEYVDTDLYKLIMSPQYLTTEHIQTFVYQMLSGLKFVHTFSVIHRDLKPANILLNEDCSLKICDFGLARIVDDGSMSHSKDSSKKRRIADDISPNPKRARTGPADRPVPKLLTRQLTKHVVTRWYRAPELILIQPYTSAVDMWSLGCIFAELLSMQEGNVPSYAERKAIFPGGTCYPLSGEGASIKADDRLDQLSAIFSVIGTPPAEDIETTGEAVKYIKTLPTMKAKPLSSLYPASDPEALDLLGKMLRFNPKKRITAEEALEHNFFKGARRKESEREADGPLEAPSFLDAEKIDLRTLKQKIFEEVLWYGNRKAEPSKP